MPTWAAAALWGFVAGAALLVGAALAYYWRVPQRWIAAIGAFGAGVLISALSFELMDEAWQQGGAGPVAGGFIGGALLFTLLNLALARAGAKHRKRSDVGREPDDNGSALALGALLDGIPESIVIGVSLLRGGAVGIVAVIAVFLSNVPEGLSSAAGMKKEGKSLSYVFLLWAGITLISGVAAMLGYAAFAGSGGDLVAAVQAIAAGAILAMIVDTMVPEAFEGTHDWAGLIAVTGFLAAFALSKMAG